MTASLWVPDDVGWGPADVDVVGQVGLPDHLLLPPHSVRVVQLNKYSFTSPLSPGSAECIHYLSLSSVHKQLIRTFFEAYIVFKKKIVLKNYTCPIIHMNLIKIFA